MSNYKSTTKRRARELANLQASFCSDRKDALAMELSECIRTCSLGWHRGNKQQA
jgi:hypothetical protein